MFGTAESAIFCKLFFVFTELMLYREAIQNTLRGYPNATLIGQDNILRRKIKITK